MKKYRLLTSGKPVWLILLIVIFFFPTVSSQSVNAFIDKNSDGVSDDYSHQSLFQNSDILFSVKDTGDIIHSIPDPGTYCQGLTWDGDYLWCSEILWGKIYQLDPLDGTVIKSFTAPGTHIEGMTWDGTYLWALDNGGGPYNSNMLYKIDPDDGAVISSFEINNAVWIHGIAWDGQYFWMNDFDTKEIYKVDPATGNIISSINAPAIKCIGLTWDGTHLWIDDFETHKLYCLDPSNGTIIYAVNGPYGNLRDLAWDGQYLWVIERTSSAVYQMDVGYVVSIDDQKLLSDDITPLSVYPNPVFDKMNIEFLLSTESKVSIEIYNQHGALINCVANKNFLPGKHVMKWDSNSQSNQKISNGIYYCVLKDGSKTTSNKFIIMR